MSTWDDGSTPAAAPMGVVNWVVAGLRFVLVAGVVFGGMVPMLALRVLGFSGAAQGVVQAACAIVLRVMGLTLVRKGTPMVQQGGVVANHSSWLDIFVLNAVQRVVFVSKAEVAKWPLVGLIVRSVGTVFIERKQSHAAKHRDIFEGHLTTGHRLLFFPEGTSTDGRRVLAFKPTLFAAFFDPAVREAAWIQPLTLAYHAPADHDARYYGWWGDADFFPHFFNVLGRLKQGAVTVTFHAPVKVADVTDRKVLAQVTQAAVAQGLADTLDVS